MPAPANVDEFVELIRKSSVVEETRLSNYLQKLKTGSSPIPTEPNKLAGVMVRDGLLTYFQAEQFLQGKWKRFTIGKYKVLERLGSGGMGQVFLCEHKLMRRRVAVKVLPTAKAEDPSSLERFYREARAVAALDHQNIVRAYDIDQDDNLHFLVMEYVDGASLHEIIKRTGQMDVLRACHYIYWSAIGLQHAHEQGLIHRDIKPGNILVDRQGVVKILDMGLARFFHDDEDMITKKFDENVLGTADYLAPEQALDSHSVDGRADIYSLGATFYFMLTGGPPFVDGTVAQKLIWHQNRDPKPIKTIRPEIPDGIVNILNKMMAKSPAARFQTPSELAAILSPWIQTPIAPPVNAEMPVLCAAVLNAGSGQSPVSMKSSNNPASVGVATIRKASASSMHLAPIPSPLGTGSSKHVKNTLAKVAEAETAKRVVVAPRAEPKVEPKIEPKVEPMPELDSPPDMGEPGAPVWESLNETNTVARADTDRKAGSSRKKNKAKPAPAETKAANSSTEKKSRQLSYLIGGGVALIAVIILVISLTSSSSSPNSNIVPPPNADGGRTLTVTKQQPANPAELRFQKLQHAFENSKPKDRIVIADDEWVETLNLSSCKAGMSIESAEGKRVIWKPENGSPQPVAVFEIGNADGFKLKNITINANNLKDIALRISGKCPGLMIDDVDLIEARSSDLKILNGAGDAARPIVIQNVHMVGSTKAPAEAGVVFFSRKPTTNQFIKIENCRIEGPFKIAAIHFDGDIGDCELKNLRVYNSTAGIFVQPKDADQGIRFVLSDSTFHTLAGPLIRIEKAEMMANPANAGRHKMEVLQTYLYNVTGGGLHADDNKPGPPVASTNNARNPATPDVGPPFPTILLEKIDPPIDAKDDKTFLRSDALKTAGPNKISIGAP